MQKITVYVVGFEAKPNFGVSFWDWYPQESAAINRKIEIEKAEDLKGNGIIYSGSLEVDNSEDEEDINRQVEIFLEENDWENSFKN